jgi:hypothetical protein
MTQNKLKTTTTIIGFSSFCPFLQNHAVLPRFLFTFHYNRVFFFPPLSSKPRGSSPPFFLFSTIRVFYLLPLSSKTTRSFLPLFHIFGLSPRGFSPNGRSITGLWFCRACELGACAKPGSLGSAKRVVALSVRGEWSQDALWALVKSFCVLRGFDRGVQTPSSSGPQSRSTARKMQHMGAGPLFLASAGPRSPTHPSARCWAAVGQS